MTAALLGWEVLACQLVTVNLKDRLLAINSWLIRLGWIELALCCSFLVFITLVISTGVFLILYCHWKGARRFQTRKEAVLRWNHEGGMQAGSPMCFSLHLCICFELQEISKPFLEVWGHLKPGGLILEVLWRMPLRKIIQESLNFKVQLNRAILKKLWPQLWRILSFFGL